MSLVKYRALMAVVEQGSLTKAGQSMGCTQSAVSHSIDSLESELGFDTLYHGECVALGMLPMCAPAVRERLIALYKKLGLPTELPLPVGQLLAACRHDKKCDGERITVVYVPRLGSYELRDVSLQEFERFIREAVA